MDLGQMSEEGLLALIFPNFPAGEGVRVGPGDDAALLRTDGAVIATTDTMVRGQDWLDAWSSGYDVGRKCVVQNCADVAAMGGVPTALLVTLAADPATDAAWVEDLARGVGEQARAEGASVVGGDLSSAGPGVLMVSITALGALPGPGPVLRSGARTGDVVAVSGPLGRAAAGLELLLADPAAQGPLPDAQRCPSPRLAAGPQAAAAGALAMIDLSDGLVRDAGRVASASGVRIDLQRAGLGPVVAALAGELPPGTPDADAMAWRCVLGGGEEHTLLATFPSDAALPEGWSAVGVAAAPGDGAPGVTLDGAPVAVQGWDHFGR